MPASKNNEKNTCHPLSTLDSGIKLIGSLNSQQHFDNTKESSLGKMKSLWDQYSRPRYIVTVVIVASLCRAPSVTAFSTIINTQVPRYHDIKLERQYVDSSKQIFSSCRTKLYISKNSPDNSGDGKNKGDRNAAPSQGKSTNKPKGRKPQKKYSQQKPQSETKTKSDSMRIITELQNRVTQLESLVSSQQVELRKYRAESDKLSDASEKLNQVLDLLRQAGLSAEQKADLNKPGEMPIGPRVSLGGEKTIEDKASTKARRPQEEFEYFDDEEIFGSAPSSVIDAADAAGSSILAALLAGKQRMLVDVRDAELTRDPDVLTQFIELSILPVAAGLEGLKTKKNRVKIIFPTVSLLMQYRKSMALAAPEVVSLSTLGFDPVEAKDNLVVIIAPAPDDDDGLTQMNELVSSENLRQPVVVLNHHMVPLGGPCGEYEPVYHLRLLSVQYMTGDKTMTDSSSKTGNQDEVSNKEDQELEAAMEHAHDSGVHQGVTRAMVIRAYPRPWHVFVDTSPDSDADFEVAATFDDIPSGDEVNLAIVECLEGSEREDELVAQQMQEALELGQLNTVSEMLGIPNIKIDSALYDDDEDEEEDDDDPWWTGTDTV